MHTLIFQMLFSPSRHLRKSGWRMAHTYRERFDLRSSCFRQTFLCTEASIRTETSRDQEIRMLIQQSFRAILGTGNDNTDNTYHVVVPSSGSVLDGFVISDGYTNYNYSNGQGQGAGLWGDSVSFTINDCNFTSNIAKQEDPAYIFMNAMQLLQIVRLRITQHSRTVEKVGLHTSKIQCYDFPFSI